MLENPLKTKLARDEPILGIWSIIPSPILAEVIATSGLDFQILDMEHGPFDLLALDGSIRACETAGCSPIVRVPGVAPFVIQSVLDLGAHGIVVPQVADQQAASVAVQCAKYAPDGTRGYNPFTRAALYKNPPNNQQGKLDNAFGFCSVIIESLSAYAALDQILEVPGLDMVYLGVYDMAVAMGCRGNTHDPQVTAFVNTAIPRIRKAGKAAGMMAMSPTDMARALDLGANVLVYGVDTYVIHRSLREAGEAFRGCAVQTSGRALT
jgi:4-hydroxy-2-oxoheptanedioate aldolase